LFFEREEIKILQLWRNESWREVWEPEDPVDGMFDRKAAVWIFLFFVSQKDCSKSARKDKGKGKV